MPRRWLAHGLVILGLGLMVGCGANPPQVSTRPITSKQYRPLYEAAIHTLGDYGFRIERKDYRHGIITTAPLGSPTILEPWKSTTGTLSQNAAGTLNDLRRRVTVMLKPRQEGDQTNQPYRLRVEALIERHELPVQRMAGASSTAIYANLTEVPAELQRRGIAGSYWQPIARDPHLEQRLLKDILRRANSRG